MSAYTESPVPLLDVLFNRIISLGVLSDGMYDLCIYFVKCYCFIYPGWNHALQKDSLSFYQLITLETGPVVGLPFTIKADYSRAVSYCNQVVSLKHCNMLQKISSLINTGKTLNPC